MGGAYALLSAQTYVVYVILSRRVVRIHNRDARSTYSEYCYIYPSNTDGNLRHVRDICYDGTWRSERVGMYSRYVGVVVGVELGVGVATEDRVSVEELYAMDLVEKWKANTI